MKSLGMIETWGHVPAVEAADAACKAANVSLIGYEQVQAGLVTVLFIGDVAAVQAAVSAGAAAARKVGKVVSTRVIARPDRQLNGIMPPAPSSPPFPVHAKGPKTEPPAGAPSSGAPQETSVGPSAEVPTPHDEKGEEKAEQETHSEAEESERPPEPGTDENLEQPQPAPADTETGKTQKGKRRKKP